MNILVTGMAGFIGFHLSKLLIEKGHKLTGIDNINPYYSVELKTSRLKNLGLVQDQDDHKFWQNAEGSIKFFQDDIAEKGRLKSLMDNYSIEVVIHLAAQPGVRYSIDHPENYIHSNILGFFELLEACRTHPVKHLVFASSSSVYGLNKDIPFYEEHKTEQPVSLYGATKKSNELMAFAYSHLFGIRVTGLRFFTVYGSFGRPDMAVYSFTEKLINDQPIEVFNQGKMSRDFTHVSDIVKSIELLMDKPPESEPPYNVVNIGGNNPYPLSRFIEILAEATGKIPNLVYKELQPGDVVDTYANTDRLNDYIGYVPQVKLEEGISEFVHWYRDYYKC